MAKSSTTTARTGSSPASGHHRGRAWARRRSVNTAMVRLLVIGREIVEVEQHGEKRAGYGDEVPTGSRSASPEAWPGFGARTRKDRQLYVTYPEGSTLPPELGGSPKRRGAVQIQGWQDSDSGADQIRGGTPAFRRTSAGRTTSCWHGSQTNGARILRDRSGARELVGPRSERQIASLLFERLAKAATRRVLALARRGTSSTGRRCAQGPVRARVPRPRRRSAWRSVSSNRRSSIASRSSCRVARVRSEGSPLRDVKDRNHEHESDRLGEFARGRWFRMNESHRPRPRMQRTTNQDRADHREGVRRRLHALRCCRWRTAWWGSAGRVLSVTRSAWYAVAIGG